MLPPAIPRYLHQADADWFLVHTHSGREKVAAINLERQGFRTFLPMQMKSVRYGRTVKATPVAYFSSYLFTTFDRLKDRWSPINNTFGVRRLVDFSVGPAPVPKAVIKELLSRTDDFGMVSGMPCLVPGNQVRINRGPFEGQLALIDQLPNESRARVLLELMQNAFPIELDRQYLEVVG
jgi:transcriptional antiterminator RfaH